MVYHRHELRLTQQTPAKPLPLPEPLPMRDYQQDDESGLRFGPARRFSSPTPDAADEALRMLDELSFSFEKLRRELDEMDDDNDPRPAA